MRKMKKYGKEIIIDLYDCDFSIISSKKHIRDFVIKLCAEIIKMKRFGTPLIEHFGHAKEITSGYSLVQLIETSSVVAHFSEFERSVYINIFSCAYFDSRKTFNYCKTFFKSKRANYVVINRL